MCGLRCACVAFAAAMQVQQAARWRSSQGGQAQKTKRESLRWRAAGLHQADGTVAHSEQRRARGGRHGASICKGGAQMMNKCHTRRSNCRLLRQSTMEESSCLFDYMATHVLEHWKKLQLSDTRNVKCERASDVRVSKAGACPIEGGGQTKRSCWPNPAMIQRTRGRQV